MPGVRRFLYFFTVNALHKLLSYLLSYLLNLTKVGFQISKSQLGFKPHFHQPLLLSFIYLPTYPMKYNLYVGLRCTETHQVERHICTNLRRHATLHCHV